MDAILERYFSIVTWDMLTILERYLTLQAVLLRIGAGRQAQYCVTRWFHGLAKRSRSPTPPVLRDLATMLSEEQADCREPTEDANAVLVFKQLFEHM